MLSAILSSYSLRSTASFILIGHQDFFRFDARQGTEAAVGDGAAEFGQFAEIAVGGFSAAELQFKALADGFRREADQFILLPGSVEAGAEHHDGVLQVLRERGHPALAVGEFELMLPHCGGDLKPAVLQLMDRKLGVLLQIARHTVETAVRFWREMLFDVPSRVIRQEGL